jgi:hypothetical protein
MAHTISQADAQLVLAQAVKTAQSDTPVPEYWERFTEEVFKMDAKTYTPALGAALLAKATDDGIDPLAIKATGERGYSLRTVGHSILVPAAQDMTHDDVRSRKINDPSRDYPGDVQAYFNDVPFLAVEVRGKPVSETELEAFITACAEVGITRAGLLVDSPSHRPIDRSHLQSRFLSAGSVHLSLYESVPDLIEAALEWTDKPQDLAASRFVTSALARLKEVEVSDSALVGWQRLVSADKPRLI